MVIQTVVGAALAFATAVAAWRVRALTAAGAVAAFGVGTAVFAAGGWRAALVLFAFFIPSALLSRVGRERKASLAGVGKHGARDAWQVLANGGVAALCALVATRGGDAFAAAFAGAFAAAAGDTWGTELGTLVRGAPRSIVTLRPVATGMSGGVTAAGTLASVAGAAVVAGVARGSGVAGFWPVAAGGIAGALCDSLLGATLQAQHWCARCDCACETNPHACGSPSTLRRGVRWLENDAVNLAATVCGALVAGAVTLLPQGR